MGEGNGPLAWVLPLLLRLLLACHCACCCLPACLLLLLLPACLLLPAALPADALKFVTVFRSQLPPQTLLSLLQPCTALLGSESVVVHSYAATAIERFLALKEGGQTKWVDQGPVIFTMPVRNLCVRASCCWLLGEDGVCVAEVLLLALFILAAV